MKKMIKKYLPTLIITALLTLLPIVFGLIVWAKLPDPMPSHFNSAGEADGFMSKAVAVFAMPAALLLIHVICALVTLMDPKRNNIDGKPFLMVLWICPVMSILVNGLVYAYALGGKINITTGALIGCGILFIILGNYLPKCGQNYSIGIKTPWALNDENNWRATHRFGGKIYVAMGVITVISAFVIPSFANAAALFWVYFVLVMISSAAPMAYSYIYYLKHDKEED